MLRLVEHVVYDDGVTDFGCGAVSGDRWKHRTFHQTRCGVALLDFYTDDRVERTDHPCDSGRRRRRRRRKTRLIAER